ncbi:GATA type transcriptional activator of nitrogen-regulated proteins [Coemansia sp. RSA 1813]|nr:GATA type transcriptional activator of nitrogen-regulated proteins [Coemansia sp. RSA 1646]KAJ1773776.1 GATA type transcriptional activator of nitrogen-regulated proteins [Coemansia sp. RSA 1843]KAJ2093739.1 GATA type transcriptional activator of nitrogen-regulated proteins [Coemansia sp. RSA 986]KAJ2217950.1 GATA type transcriptional activator of nitrogen-regulated proteins [Coemansia sp. RSA 487]KAJ2573207.1 GATA type transcriptional activator of nitrogen-regulated proteins [Coemansia sp. 
MTDSANTSDCFEQKQQQQLHSCNKSYRLSISALLQSPPPSFVDNTSDTRCSSASASSTDIKKQSSPLLAPITPSLPSLRCSSPSSQNAHICATATAAAASAETATSKPEQPVSVIKNQVPIIPTPSGVLHVQSPAGSNDNGGSISCMNCKTTATPLWRRDPTTGSHLCNRCGLYLKTYNVMHPLTRIKRRAIGSVAGSPKIHAASQDNKGSCAASKCSDHTTDSSMDDVEQIPRPANCNPPELQYLPKTQQPKQRRITPKQQISLGMTPKCFNCSAEQTPLWRRDPQDNIICNACGLFYKLHGKARPVSMKRAAIRRRNRTTLSTVCPQSPDSQQQQQQQSRSAPAADGGSIAGAIANPSRPYGGRMGGLDFLMQAAELRLSPQDDSCTIAGRQYLGTRHACKDPKINCDLKLESLASVAMAEMMVTSGDSQKQRPQQKQKQLLCLPKEDSSEPETANKSDMSHEAKEKLRLECQRLEQLLAQSRAMLGSFEQQAHEEEAVDVS